MTLRRLRFSTVAYPILLGLGVAGVLLYACGGEDGGDGGGQGGGAHTSTNDASIDRDTDPPAPSCAAAAGGSSGPVQAPILAQTLIVLDAAGNELHKVVLYQRGSMAAPSVGDLDGDGELELVISLKDTLGGGDGGVQIWDLPGSADNCVLWGTGRGGSLRQGYVASGVGVGSS